MPGRRRARWLGATGLAAACLMAPAPAAAQDTTPGKNDFGGFRNVLPGGQGETVNAEELAANQTSDEVPRSFLSQHGMYKDLVFAAPTLSAADLDRYFKPEVFGVPAGQLDSEATVRPKSGVTILRDRAHQVPHVYGTTRANTMFGAGYASAQDRMFLMDVLRHTGRGRLSELIGPGSGDANVEADLEQLRVADYTEAEQQKMIDTGVRDAGAEGQQMKQDLDNYVAGINKYIEEARSDPDKMPGEYAALGKELEDWKPTDTVAIASLIGGIFGRGGGNESSAAQVFQAARQRFGSSKRGRKRARRVFKDFRRQDDPEAPVTVKKRFPFDNPGKVNPRAVALLDLGTFRDPERTFERTTSVLPGLPFLREGGASAAEAERAEQIGRRARGWVRELRQNGLGLRGPSSNALLVHRKNTTSGRPVAVMGPQVGYYSPEILMEIDMHGGGIDTRGATFPGISLYVLLGRGQDFAWSATTATTDVVDEFVEKLCEPDGSRATIKSDHYMYKGRCRPFLKRNHVIRTEPGPVDLADDPGARPKTYTLKLLRSVHGPIQGRATVNGEPVAIAEARSTYMHELDSALAFKRLNSNEVRDAKSFQRAMHKINFAFNWFYADDRDIAYLQSGWYPRRAKGVDPSFPAWGTGEFDWQKFDPDAYTERRMKFRHLPKAINPKLGYLVNWNNKQAPGWRSADDVWEYGPVHRSMRLEKRLRKALKRGKIDAVGLTKVMELGATVDLRGQEIYPLLRRVIGKKVKDPDVADALKVLDGWRKRGAHRRDLTRDNVYEDSAAVALMDAWWEPLMRRMFEPALGPKLIERIRSHTSFDQPPGPGGSAYFTGWWGYASKDLRRLLGRRVRGKLSRRYCGSGAKTAKQARRRCRAVITGTLDDAVARVRKSRGSDMSTWKVPATCEVESGNCDQIEFTTAGAVATPPIPWQDRPTFQQVVEVRGHRPR